MHTMADARGNALGVESSKKPCIQSGFHCRARRHTTCYGQGFKLTGCKAMQSGAVLLVKMVQQRYAQLEGGTMVPVVESP